MITEFMETFRRPSAAVMARRQLEDAERRLLEVQSQAEYHQRMVQYYGDVVKRLSHYVREVEQ